ncbi:YfjI family protein [Serratia proteamaculans]|uniref:YfjI family protein n=1 Tax=Serratia proteamaculans TaxID=28151 RepID=UPI0039BE7BA1
MTSHQPSQLMGPQDQVASSNPAGYPVNSLPPLLREVIQRLYEDTQIPIEMIGSTVLSAASLTCQSLIDVIQPHSYSEPEQCSLYFLTIAASGEGKTTIFKPIMKPFYEFSAEMKRDYQHKLVKYKKLYDVWKTTKQALDSKLKQAVKNNQDSPAAESEIAAHLEDEPQKPKCLNILYEDATPKTIIFGLNEYPYAAFMSDEAITFLRGYAKNNLGLFNKAWGGETYVYQRPDGEIIELNACLTISLMVQPGVFMDYLKKHGEIAESSGFISRFLFTNTISTVGHRNGNSNYDKSTAAIGKLHGTISALLEKQKEKFYCNNFKKKTLKLSEEAVELWKKYRTEIAQETTTGKKWEHINSIASKSGSNAIRLAAIFQYISDEESEEVTAKALNCAYSVIRWHLDQASALFYPMSDNFVFEHEVYDLFSWMKTIFEKNKNFPFLKNEIEKFGPNRLRRKERLEPVLNKLISMGLVCTFREAGNSALKIAMSQDNGSTYIGIPTFDNWLTQIVSSWKNTQSRDIVLDKNKLNWWGC